SCSGLCVGDGRECGRTCQRRHDAGGHAIRGHHHFSSWSGVRLNVPGAGTGDSSLRPSVNVISISNPPGSPFNSGATIALIMSPGLTDRDVQPARESMLMLVNSIV